MQNDLNSICKRASNRYLVVKARGVTLAIKGLRNFATAMPFIAVIGRRGFLSGRRGIAEGRGKGIDKLPNGPRRNSIIFLIHGKRVVEPAR